MDLTGKKRIAELEAEIIELNRKLDREHIDAQCAADTITALEAEVVTWKKLAENKKKRVHTLQKLCFDIHELVMTGGFDEHFIDHMRKERRSSAAASPTVSVAPCDCEV